MTSRRQRLEDVVIVLDDPQKARALMIANAERTKRAELRHHLKAMTSREAAREACQILADCPHRYGALPIGQFLRMIPRIGTAKSKRMLRYDLLKDDGTPWLKTIDTSRKIGDLTLQERWHVIAALERYPRPTYERKT